MSSLLLNLPTTSKEEERVSATTGANKEKSSLSDNRPNRALNEDSLLKFFKQNVKQQNVFGEKSVHSEKVNLSSENIHHLKVDKKLERKDAAGTVIVKGKKAHVVTFKAENFAEIIIIKSFKSYLLEALPEKPKEKVMCSCSCISF